MFGFITREHVKLAIGKALLYHGRDVWAGHVEQNSIFLEVYT